MKKSIKVIVSLMLALCSIFTLCFSVFATLTEYPDSASAPIYTVKKSDSMYSILQSYIESEHESEVFYKDGIRLSSGEYAYGYIGYNADVCAFYIMTLGAENGKSAGYRWTYKFDLDGYWKYRVSYDGSNNSDNWIEVSGFNIQFYDHIEGHFTSVPENCGFLFTETSESFVPDQSVIYTYGQIEDLDKKLDTAIVHGETLFVGYCYIDVLGAEPLSVKMLVDKSDDKISVFRNGGELLLSYNAEDLKWKDYATGDEYDSIKIRIGSVIEISPYFHYAFEHLGKRYEVVSPEIITSILDRYKDFSTSKFICNAYVSVIDGVNVFRGQEDCRKYDTKLYINNLYTEEKIAKVQFRYEPAGTDYDGYLRVISFKENGELNDSAFLKFASGKWIYSRQSVNSLTSEELNTSSLEFVFYDYDNRSITADVPAELNSYFTLKDFCESHNYFDGTCINCGLVCPHIECKFGTYNEEDGTVTCSDCGKTVSHEHSFVFKSSAISNGVQVDVYECVKCGYVKESTDNCSHVWEWDSSSLVSRCSKCGLACSCPIEGWEYDPESGKEICTVCGMQWPHIHKYLYKVEDSSGEDEQGSYYYMSCSCGDKEKVYYKKSDNTGNTGDAGDTGSEPTEEIDFSKVIGVLAVVVLIAGAVYLYVSFSDNSKKVSGKHKLK